MLSILTALALTSMPVSDPSPPIMPRAEWEPYVESELRAISVLTKTDHPDGAWRRLRAVFRRCPRCSEDCASEDFGSIAASLLAHHPDLMKELAPLAKEDPEWFAFVLRRLHGPLDPLLLRRAAENTKNCTPGHAALCDRIGTATLQAAIDAEAELRAAERQ